MPRLPTVEKTWEFDPNRAVGAGTEDETNGTSFYELITRLTDGGIFTRPWVMKGSSDGSSSGMDGVNRIASAVIGAINDNPGNAHAWAVLEQPGIQFDGAANPLQVLFSRNSSTASDWSIVISMADGFGAANGGSDGSHLQDPTATDQWSTIYQDGLYSGSGNLPNLVQTIAMTDDGTITRILMSGVTTARRRWLSFEVPKNPRDGWERPFVLVSYADSFVSSFNSTGTWSASPTYPNGVFFRPYETVQPGLGALDAIPGLNVARGRVHSMLAGGGSSKAVETHNGLHPTENARLITDAYIHVGDDFGFGGYWGELSDFYFIGTGAGIGDSLPATGEKRWWCYGVGIIAGPNDSATDISL